MNPGKTPEHYVTLFDSYFLPQGLCLYRSLERHCSPFHLWIVAVDGACEQTLLSLGLEHATVVKLSDVENPQLLRVKPGRSIGEYCWTLTPFLPDYIWRQRPEVGRVTYVDADLFFFDAAKPFFDELSQTAKEVLITEHAFAPEYSKGIRHGRFCVQFITFVNSGGAHRVLKWWQDRCIEWCFARHEDGKYGDQKYLDTWPDLFRREVHVLSQTDRTVAPWNVDYLGRASSVVRPVFYHFHGVRLTGPDFLVLWSNYVISRRNRWIYDRYLDRFRQALAEMRGVNVEPGWRPVPEKLRWLRVAWRLLRGRFVWTRL